MTIRFRLEYRWLQFLLLGLSLVLVALAFPASRAPGLSLHANDLCVLVGILFFGVIVLAALLPVGRLGQYFLAGGFLGAWLIQGLALHWIEGVWIHDLFGAEGNLYLRVWLSVYYSSVVVVPLGVAAYVTKSKSFALGASDV